MNGFLLPVQFEEDGLVEGPQEVDRLSLFRPLTRQCVRLSLGRSRGCMQSLHGWSACLLPVGDEVGELSQIIKPRGLLTGATACLSALRW